MKGRNYYLTDDAHETLEAFALTHGANKSAVVEALTIEVLLSGGDVVERVAVTARRIAAKRRDRVGRYS